MVYNLKRFVYLNNYKKREERNTIILVSSYLFQVKGLEHIVDYLYLPLPDKNDIKKELGFCDIKPEDVNGDFNYPKDSENAYVFSKSFMRSETFEKNVKKLLDSLVGLHLYDIRSILHTIQSETKRNVINTFFPGYKDVFDRISIVKKQAVNNSGLLEIVDVGDFEYDKKVGNIDGLKKYLYNQKKCMDSIKDSENLKLKKAIPKGILLVGESGCGKSEAAKCVSAILGYPLYRMNIGNLLGSWVGQSEHQFRDALSIVDGAEPCVLWIDELEKAFSGAGKNFNNNNDVVLTRILGYFLTWMQEHETLVYLVATANDLTQMKDEFLRKGRWDDIFYFMKPDYGGAYQIFEASLKKYGAELKEKNELREFLKRKDGDEQRLDLSGSDIGNIIVECIRDDIKLYPSISFDNLKDKIDKELVKKRDAERERIDINCDRDLLDMEIQHRLNHFSDKDNKLDKEFIRAKLVDKYRKETRKEIENRYKSAGYTSAATGK